MINPTKNIEWPLLPLEEVATLKRGYDLPVKKRTNGDFVVFAANGSHGTHNEHKAKGPGVITGRSGTIGKVHFSKNDFWPLNTALYVKNFHGNDPKWVYYMLQNFRLERFAQGAGVPTLNRNLVHGVKIPLPPLAEQKRIAAILDKADTIRSKRQAAIKLADEFLRTTFLDMFGDPVTNPKGWDTVPLKDLGHVTTGNTPSRKRFDFYGDDIEWIKSDNINTPNHFLTKAAEGLSREGEKIARKVAHYSTLVTCIAGSFDCIGNAALSDREVAFNQQINAITPKKDIDPFFLYCLILNAKKMIQNASTNSMKGMVSKGKFEQILFPHPPKNLQEKFSLFFQNHLESINKVQSLEKLSCELFNSLSQRAFQGEL